MLVVPCRRVQRAHPRADLKSSPHPTLCSTPPQNKKSKKKYINSLPAAGIEPAIFALPGLLRYKCDALPLGHTGDRAEFLQVLKIVKYKIIDIVC